MALSIDVTWAKRAAKAILLIRVLVGWVFLSEGIQKFLFADSLGVGRFVKIGIPWPQVARISSSIPIIITLSIPSIQSPLRFVNSQRLFFCPFLANTSSFVLYPKKSHEKTQRRDPRSMYPYPLIGVDVICTPLK